MPEALVIGLLIAFPLIGLLTRRWLAVALPIVAWPVFYTGLVNDWWFYGVGDGWQYVATFITLLGVGSTALAVSLGRAFRPPPKTHLLRLARPS